MGFIILKTFGSSSLFQRKNRFLKMCPVAWVICQNVINFGLPNQTFSFHHNLVNISGLDAYFSKPIFALKSWARAERFEYNEANERSKFFFTYNGPSRIKKANWEGLKLLQFSSNFNCELIIYIVMGKWFAINDFQHIWFFEPPYRDLWLGIRDTGIVNRE